MSNAEGKQVEPITISLAKYYSGPDHVPLGRPGIMGPKISSALVISGKPTGGAHVVHHQYKENGESSVEKKELSAEELAPMTLLVDRLQTLPSRKTPGGSDIYGANTSVVVSQGRNVLWQHYPGGGCGVSPDDEDDDEVAAFANFDAHKESFVRIVDQIYSGAGASASTSAKQDNEE